MQKWAGDETGTLQNDLLLDSGDIISAEPPRRIMAMALIAKSQPNLPELLANHEAPIPGSSRQFAETKNSPHCSRAIWRISATAAWKS